MFAVIYIPNFQLQALLRLEPELRSRPVALLDDRIPKSTVFQFTETAAGAGITPGLTSTQAMARCREVIVKSRSPAQEAAAGEAFLQCAYCFSPSIEATAPGVCTLDLQGLSDAGTEPWANQILTALSQIALDARIGVAETPGLAWHAARCAKPFLAVGDSDEFISGLAIERLEPPAETLEILQKWGIHSVGSFLALGKDKIADRLGAEGVELFEFASARQVRPLKRVIPTATFEESIDFENQIESLEPLLFILHRFIEQLCNRLAVIYLVAQELHLQLGLSSGQKYERLFRIPAPTRNVETLFRMLQTHLDGVRTESPISSLRLSATPCRAENYQFGFFETALRDPNQFHETLARLTALLGTERVGTPRLEETHRPDALRMEPAQFEAAPDARELLADAPAAPPVIPLRRFRPPLPAVVEMRANRPVLLRSAPFTGPLIDTQGPWRTSGDWWNNQAWARDEWDVQTQTGEIYRLVQQEDQWFVEGVFD